MPKTVKFPYRITVSFSEDQSEFLCDSIREGKAEGIAQLLRQYVNEKMGEKNND